jgi:integrase
MLLTHSEPRSGSHWTNNGRPREQRELKHRAPGETRPVPVHPELVFMLRSHLKQYGTGPHGRDFVGARGGALTDRAYLAVFHKARDAAFSGPEAASLLARRPYDLRRARQHRLPGTASSAPPPGIQSPGLAARCLRPAPGARA